MEQVVKESTNALFGIDPGSTRITLTQPEDKPGTRARVTFFISMCKEDSRHNFNLSGDEFAPTNKSPTGHP